MTFDPPLDPGIARYVEALVSSGVETFESCEGGPGHAFPVPTIRIRGGVGAGFIALGIAQMHGLPVAELRQVWDILDLDPTGPYWEMTFTTKGDT